MRHIRHRTSPDRVSGPFFDEKVSDNVNIEVADTRINDLLTYDPSRGKPLSPHRNHLRHVLL